MLALSGLGDKFVIKLGSTIVLVMFIVVILIGLYYYVVVIIVSRLSGFYELKFSWVFDYSIFLILRTLIMASWSVVFDFKFIIADGTICSVGYT